MRYVLRLVRNGDDCVEKWASLTVNVNSSDRTFMSVGPTK